MRARLLDYEAAAARVERLAVQSAPEASEAAGAATEPEVPPSFICPITQEVMHDPVSTVDGQVYERSAIAAWLEARDTAPLTGAVLPMKLLIPNVPLRSLIREWRERQAS